MSSEGTGGTPWHDLEEDLAECIAVWQESGHSRTPEFPRIQPPRSPLARGRSQNGHYGANQEAAPFVPQESVGPVMSLNVGGLGFKSTASTLRKAPFFEAMLRHL